MNNGCNEVAWNEETMERRDHGTKRPWNEETMERSYQLPFESACRAQTSLLTQPKRDITTFYRFIIVVQICQWTRI